MFKKLRNRLLLVNMIIISALLLGSFAVIYIITYQNIYNTTSDNLIQVLEFEHRMRAPAPPDGIEIIHDPESAQPIRQRRNPEPEARPEMPGSIDRRADMMAQFVITISKDGEITDIHSPFEIDIENNSLDIDKIISDEGVMHIISYSGGYWAYLTQKEPDGYRVGFVDYTSERHILFNLLIILTAVWIAALAVTFIISLSNANKSIKPVEDSYNRQKQFVADASHELKTPLTTINTNIDVLLSHPESTIGEEKKWLYYLKSETERMTKLTNDLLYLARLDHTEDEPVKCISSLSEAAENVILTMEAVAFEKNISFNYDIEPGISVYAPDEQMKQTMMILLDNAIKYTPVGGIINMSLEKEKNDAILKVRNSGEGIDKEDLKHIFDRFYRADKSRARESGGYGLGLAIAKSICDSCGGEIEVESEQGKYTEFVIRLKIA